MVGVAAAAPALAGPSTAGLWVALGNSVACGLSIHLPGQAPRLLCSSRTVPAPKHGGNTGDPGFVFLGSAGRPQLARLSQDTFASSHQVRLPAGANWQSVEIGVRCTIGATAVRCANPAGHGFTITRHSYQAF